MKKIAVLCSIICFALRLFAQNLIPGGDLSRLDENGWVKGWEKFRGTKVVSLSGVGRVLEVKGKTGAGAKFVVPLRSEWGVLTLDTAMKTEDVVLGKDPWCTARIPMCFQDKNHKKVGRWPDVFGFIGTTDWHPCKRDYLIPEGAKFLLIEFCNLGKSGTIWFQPISLRVKRNRAVKGENRPLPEGAPKDPWTLKNAWQVKSATQGRYCLNGLWQFRPIFEGEDFPTPPAEQDNWGWGKIPAAWHNIGAHNPAQQFYFSYWLEDHPPKDLSYKQAWYRRILTVPSEAAGHRATLDFSFVQTHAKVWIDRQSVGEVFYPGGELEISRWLKPGQKQQIDFLVTARPLDLAKEEFYSPEVVAQKKIGVNSKGLTGDLFLNLYPQKGGLRNPQVICSTSKGTITFIADADGLQDADYHLVADVSGCGTKKRFEARSLKPDASGKIQMTATWPDAKYWDTHTPQNIYQAVLSLSDAEDKLIDQSLPITFGFREVRQQGRDVYLNNVPIHLRAIRNSNINGSAACKESVRAQFAFYRKYGFNFIITFNYGFSPGWVSYMEDLLDVCDETGMLVAISLPHIRDYDFSLSKSEVAEKYRRHTQWLIQKIRKHPSVIFYAMNHNSVGYPGMQNPLLIDGIFDMPKTGKDWWVRNRAEARRSEEVVRSIDPTRLVYHHNGANLGDIYSINIYLNWAAIQERSDWLQHWATEGIKPLFFVEWGLPHISTWSSYRGPRFIWSTSAFQSLWASEYAAQFYGDAAYEESPQTYTALAKEEKFWKTGEPFSWGRMCKSLRPMTNHYQKVQALFAADNWRCFRGWGITAMLPWDQETFWDKISEPQNPINPNAMRDLKNPGIAVNYFDGECISAVTNLAPTAVGKIFTRWNQADCAFIGGDSCFTDKRHLFRPGEKFTKKLVLINDRRVPQTVQWQCKLVGSGETQKGSSLVQPGMIAQLPVSFLAPKKAGNDRLEAEFVFEGNVRQSDAFSITVIPEEKQKPSGNVWLYDPQGETAKNFDRLGIRYQKTGLGNSIPGKGTLVIGRKSLPNDFITRAYPLVKSGLRVIVLEQSAKQLESIGFRVAEHGTRNFFPRYKNSIFADLDEEKLRDWAGEATLIPPYLDDLQKYETHIPLKKWCNMTSTRVWRCGNRGSVASVLPEKPTAGDWRAFIDGGFDLQYSPLLQWTVQHGCFIFCQLDVTGRTAPDPVADTILLRLFRLQPYASWETLAPHGVSAYQHCVAHRVSHMDIPDWDHEVWMISSGIKPPADYSEQVKKGKTVLCLGLTAEEVKAWCPVSIKVEESKGEFFTRIKKLPKELNGLSNADWAWHGSMDFAAFTEPCDEGNRAFRIVRYGKGRVVFWQVPPWKIDAENRPYLRTSRRRAEVMFARLVGNLGGYFNMDCVRYQDIPQVSDDPYRYYPW